MRGADRVAAHALQHLHAEGLQAVRHRRANSASVVVQAVAVAAVSFLLGAAAMWLLATYALPREVPVALVWSRVVQVAVGLVVMSALGAAVSLRRVVRADPASAIG